MNRRERTKNIIVSLFCGCIACPAAPEGEDPVPVKTLTLEELRDPKSCQACHQQHYEEWSASMHAYASKDLSS